MASSCSSRGEFSSKVWTVTSLHSRLNALNVRSSSHAPSPGRSQYSHSKRLNSRCGSVQSEDWFSDRAHRDSAGYHTTWSGNRSVGQDQRRTMIYVFHITSIASQVRGVRSSAHTTRLSFFTSSTVHSVGIFSLRMNTKGFRVTVAPSVSMICFVKEIPSSRVHCPGMLTEVSDRSVMVRRGGR